MTIYVYNYSLLSKFGTDQKAIFKNETILKYNNNELKLRKGMTIDLRKLKYAFGCNEGRYLYRNDKKITSNI